MRNHFGHAVKGSVGEGRGGTEMVPATASTSKHLSRTCTRPITPWPAPPYPLPPPGAACPISQHPAVLAPVLLFVGAALASLPLSNLIGAAFDSAHLVHMRFFVPVLSPTGRCPARAGCSPSTGNRNRCRRRELRGGAVQLGTDKVRDGANYHWCPALNNRDASALVLCWESFRVALVWWSPLP